MAALETLGTFILSRDIVMNRWRGPRVLDRGLPIVLGEFTGRVFNHGVHGVATKIATKIVNGHPRPDEADSALR